MTVTEAIERAGGAISLAQMLGVTRQSVYKWKWNGDKFPQERMADVTAALEKNGDAG